MGPGRPIHPPGVARPALTDAQAAEHAHLLVQRLQQSGAAPAPATLRLLATRFPHRGFATGRGADLSNELIRGVFVEECGAVSTLRMEVLLT